MTLEQVFETVGAQLQDWTGGLCDEPLDKLRTRHERLTRDLGRRCALLVSQRAVVHGLRHRKTILEERVVRLAEQVEVFTHLGDHQLAWNTALELDQERELLQRECEQLEAHEQAYREQRDDIDYLKERLAVLRQRIERKAWMEM
jgi:hypothetical protein